MSNAFIQISPDSSGKKVQVFENVIGGQTVEATAVSLVNASGVAVTGAAPLPVVSAAFGTSANAVRVNSTAFEASRILKAGPGTLISCQGYSKALVDQFLLFFDSTTVPADGATAVWFTPLIAQSYFAVEVPLTGIPFSTGITVANSTTIPTKTTGAAGVSITTWFLAVIQ